MEVQGRSSSLAPKVQLVHHSHRSQDGQLFRPARYRTNLWLPYRVQEGDDCFEDDVLTAGLGAAPTLTEIDSQSDMVKTMAPVYKGKKQPTMFAAADNRTHARIRRPVASAYSMTNIIQVRRLGRTPCILLFLEKTQLLFRLFDSLASLPEW